MFSSACAISSINAVFSTVVSKFVPERKVALIVKEPSSIDGISSEFVLLTNTNAPTKSATAIHITNFFLCSNLCSTFSYPLFTFCSILLMGSSFFSCGLNFLNKSGMIVIATTNEVSIAMIIVMPSCANNCPDNPFMVLSGRYTTTVVIVDAMIDAVTNPVPFSADSWYSPVSSFSRKQLSNTTIELSTIIPIAMTNAPKVTTLNVNPSIFMPIIVANREMGIELPTIRLALKSPKKINSTNMDKMTPNTSVSATEDNEEIIASLALYVTSITTVSLLACSLSNIFSTDLVTSTVP